MTSATLDPDLPDEIREVRDALRRGGWHVFDHRPSEGVVALRAHSGAGCATLDAYWEREANGWSFVAAYETRVDVLNAADLRTLTG